MFVAVLLCVCCHALCSLIDGWFLFFVFDWFVVLVCVCRACSCFAFVCGLVCFVVVLFLLLMRV